MLKFKFLAIVAIFALVAAACGDSGTPVTDAATGAPTGDSTAPTSGGTAITEGIPVTIGNVPGVSSECEALLNVFLAFTNIFSGGGIPIVNLDAVGDLPGELQADAVLVIEGVQAYSDGLEELGVDLSDTASLSALTEEQQQAFGELAESLDTDEFNAATDRLSEYGESECADFVPGG